MKKLLILLPGFLLLLLAGCKKVEFDNDPTGEALTDFKLSTPASNTDLVLNAATPLQPITITWTASKPGINTAPTYKWVLAYKSSNDIDQPLIEIAADNGGLATQLTITHQQLDDALEAKGIAEGAKTLFIWSVVADNGTTVVRSSDIFDISITRFKDGATPFILLAPASSSAPVAIDPGSTSQSITFRWTRSFPAAGGPAVTYKVLITTDGNFASPLFTLTPNAAPADTTASITYKALSDSLNAHGLTDLGSPSNLKWTVVATSGTWNQRANYVNELVILREVRMYLAGNFQSATGNGTDWTPGNGPEMILDKRPGLINNMYYIYIYMPANTYFKFTQGRAWDVNYGGSGGALAQNGSDINIPAAGVYRISVNRTTMQYDVRAGRMGFVGNATASDWNPSAVFPANAMGFASEKNLFVGIHNFVPGGWKLIDNDAWNNGSNTVDETRSYGTPNPSGSTLEINGANFADITAASRQRVIWDGRDVNNTKYEMSPATEMRLVGNGMDSTGVGDWNPASSPQMAYLGNGQWRINILLKADMEIKFLAGNDWGAFDYEDNGDGGSAGPVIKRKIRWEGGNNFRTPLVAGRYTITLDEYTQTVTIE